MNIKQFQALMINSPFKSGKNMYNLNLFILLFQQVVFADRNYLTYRYHQENIKDYFCLVVSNLREADT